MNENAVNACCGKSMFPRGKWCARHLPQRLRHSITGAPGSSPGKVPEWHIWILCRRPSPPFSAECQAWAESQRVPCHTPPPLSQSPVVLSEHWLPAVTPSWHSKMMSPMTDWSPACTSWGGGGGRLSGSSVTGRAGAHVWGRLSIFCCCPLPLSRAPFSSHAGK